MANGLPAAHLHWGLIFHEAESSLYQIQNRRVQAPDVPWEGMWCCANNSLLVGVECVQKNDF